MGLGKKIFQTVQKNTKKAKKNFKKDLKKSLESATKVNFTTSNKLMGASTLVSSKQLSGKFRR